MARDCEDRVAAAALQAGAVVNGDASHGCRFPSPSRRSPSAPWAGPLNRCGCTIARRQWGRQGGRGRHRGCRGASGQQVTSRREAGGSGAGQGGRDEGLGQRAEDSARSPAALEALQPARRRPGLLRDGRHLREAVRALVRAQGAGAEIHGPGRRVEEPRIPVEVRRQVGVPAVGPGERDDGDDRRGALDLRGQCAIRRCARCRGCPAQLAVLVVPEKS
jgi:hypothetical protein